MVTENKFGTVLSVFKTIHVNTHDRYVCFERFVFIKGYQLVLCVFCCGLRDRVFLEFGKFRKVDGHIELCPRMSNIRRGRV